MSRTNVRSDVRRSRSEPARPPTSAATPSGHELRGAPRGARGGRRRRWRRLPGQRAMVFVAFAGTGGDAGEEERGKRDEAAAAGDRVDGAAERRGDEEEGAGGEASLRVRSAVRVKSRSL